MEVANWSFQNYWLVTWCHTDNYKKNLQEAYSFAELILTNNDIQKQSLIDIYANHKRSS